MTGYFGEFDQPRTWRRGDGAADEIERLRALVEVHEKHIKWLHEDNARLSCPTNTGGSANEIERLRAIEAAAVALVQEQKKIDAIAQRHPIPAEWDDLVRAVKGRSE